MLRKFYQDEEPNVIESPLKLYRSLETGHVGPFNDFWYMCDDEEGRQYWGNITDNLGTRSEEVSIPFTAEEAYVAIRHLGSTLEEKRSDIAEILYQFLQTGKMDVSGVEHRFISIRIPHDADEVEYDTMTTQFSFHTFGKPWEPSNGNEEYYDDTPEADALKAEKETLTVGREEDYCKHTDDGLDCVRTSCYVGYSKRDHSVCDNYCRFCGKPILK